MNDKSLGQIAAEGFGYSDWNALSGSMRADFQRAGEAVSSHVKKEIADTLKEAFRKAHEDRERALGFIP